MANSCLRSRLEMPSWSFYQVQFSVDFPCFSEDSFCLFFWTTISQVLTCRKSSWQSECSFPRMLFILSKYSPWDHYIFPMIEDYYFSLLVIFLALVPFFLLSYNNVWMSFYLLQSFWCLGSKPICKIPRTMSSQWTHTGL